MNLTIRQITHFLKGQLILGDPKAMAYRASIDSRSIQSGDLFFALKGERADGHDFALAACHNGAVGAVVSHLDWFKASGDFRNAIIQVPDTPDALKTLGRGVRQGFKGPVIAVTGSNGKTTTKQMIASIMGKRSAGLFTKENFNSRIGLPLVLSELKESHRWMVLELGASQRGDIDALCDIAQPTIGVVTSIGYEHLETFGTLETIAATHWELMDALPNDGCAVVPWGEPRLEPFIRTYNRRVVFWGEDSSCPVRSSAIDISEKIRFRLHIGNESALVQLPVPAKWNVGNALASAAAAWAAGCSLEQVVQGLESFEPPKMRMEIIPHSSGALFINDAYNANPSSVIQSVRSFVETYPDRLKIVVLGSMLELGDVSEKMHFHVGTEIGRYPFHRIYLFGKETEAIKEGALSVKAPADRFFVAEKEKDIAERLKWDLASGTVVLFKGSRGMELEKIIEELG